MNKKILFLLSISIVLFSSNGDAQDTVKVQSFDYYSLTRDTIIEFPNTGESYEKILMRYNMRCHDATVSSSGNNWGPHQGGCGEWDYSCNTYLTDSTRTDSVLSYHVSHDITGFTGSSYDYSTTTTYRYTQSTQKDVTVNSSTPSDHSISTGATNLTDLLNTAGFAGKTQTLFTSVELSGAGLTAGNIYGMSLDINSTNSDANFMRIRMKNTDKTSLDPSDVDNSGFTEVYFTNTNFVNGLNYLQFYNPFNWDDSKNIIVEISFTNSTASSNTEIQGGNSGFNSTLISNGNSYTEYTGIEDLQISTTAMSSISNEITVSAWIYGNEDIMPANSYLFEGKDASGNRTVNVHLPWSNGNIYWDCGNSGGTYDRIEQAAVSSEYEGVWRHWTFTKNAATGDMKMYLNGNLWHSGTGKTLPIDIESFSVGHSDGGSGVYYGYIDEFRVWDKELDQTTIQSWMNTSIDATHPDYANLVAYYKLDEGTGTLANDSSPNAETGNFIGGSNWSNQRGNQLNKFFQSSTNRPNITFTQGTFDISVADVTVLDSVENKKNIVTEYGITFNSGTQNSDIVDVVSTTEYWPAGNLPLYDEDGNQIGTKDISSDGTINITELLYHRRYPSKYELLSLVTPYGNGLDLGVNGKTFIFDITDFGPILKDKKRITVERGGQWQEELDVQFLFIKGTPPRDVRNIQQIWRDASENYTNIISERVFEDRTIQTDPTAGSFKIRSSITGHGQEGEFISRNHSININGGAAEFSWDVWKECARNPIYPQGGTWPADRAGWCPGMATDVQELPLDDYVTPGDAITVDYSVANGSGDSRYIVNNQLVTYGPSNFNLDAAVKDIKYPDNKRVEYERFNPTCNLPLIEIQNTGSTDLTSLKIDYNVKGGTVKTYTWSGNLKFMESTEVELPVDDVSFWDSGSGEAIFEVSVKEPNGGSDEYSNNNTYQSTFDAFDRFTDRIEVLLKTNNAPGQNSWKLYDDNGNVVISKSGFDANSTIKNEIHVNPGCYTFEFMDNGDNGLSYWAQSSQGSGSLRIREYNSSTSSFQTKITFNPDFGEFIRYDFHSDGLVNVSETNSFTNFSIYPNPTEDAINVELTGFEGKKAEIEITNQVGQILEIIEIEELSNKSLNQFDLSKHAPGVYFVKVNFGKEFRVEKIIKQ